MKIMVWSRYGDSLSLARLMKEKDGNDVKLYIDIDYNKRVGENIVPKVENWKDYIDWADLIMVDDENQGEWVEELENQGRVIFGTNRFGGKLENDREYAFQLCKELGIKTVPYWKLNSLDEGIEFIKKNPGKYVFKPFGQRPRWYTKVGELVDGRDMIWFIEYLKKVWIGAEEFILQKYVEGVEVGCCSWFNREKFLKPLEICFEHKKMRGYGQGGNVGEAGSLLFAVNESRIFDEILKPFESYLKATKYVGQFYVNTKVNEEGICVLEFVPRLGIPATYGYNELLQVRWSDLFYKLATVELQSMPIELGRYVIVVKLDVEPVPDLEEESNYYVPSEIPIFFDFDPIGVEPGFFEGDLKKENNQYYLTGKQGHIGCVIGSGSTVQEAQDLTYKTAEKIHSPVEIVYNPEIGDKFEFVGNFLTKEKII